MADLFESSAQPAQQPIADDDFSAIAREVYGAPPGSRWLKIETLGSPDIPRELACFRLVTGVLPSDGSGYFKTGTRKGRPNIRKRDKALDRELVVPFKDFDAFVAKRKAARGTLTPATPRGQAGAESTAGASATAIGDSQAAPEAARG